MVTVRLLGPVEVHRDGQAVDLGGPQQRAVLAHLALDAGRVVSVERLIDLLWGENPPRTPLGTLQSYVSRLRRAIEPMRESGLPPQLLVSEAPGYMLRMSPENIDVQRFESLVSTGRAVAATANHRLALDRFDAALDLWRGPALGGLGNDERTRSIVLRLDEERAAVREDRFEVMLALGRHAEAAPALQAAVDEQPLRERLSALLALALYRSGRQVEALRVLTDVRTRLLEELGLDPGPELREMETKILDHDPSLVSRPTTEAAVTVTPQPVAPRHTEPVGRCVEWRRLQAALDDAATGRGHMVLVEGEPGIGKSTLCEAFLHRASQTGWRTVTGRCIEPGLAPSLWPCIEVVRSMIDIAGQEDGTSTATLQFMVANESQSNLSLSPVQLADQFIALLDELGRPPWVIFLDDLHWADQATLRMIALVLERIGSRPLFVLGAYRPPELVPGSLLGSALGVFGRSSALTKIHMPPLESQDVALLIEQTVGTLPSPAVASRVQERAGGNPLFVAELARLVGERGVTDDSIVPDAIRDVVRARLLQLPESSTAELEVVAVLGERFDLRTAIATSERDPDNCLDALDAAIVTRILVPDADGLRFAHALVRDTVLSEVSPLRRARLHRRAADAILATRGDGPDVAEPIAHHRLESITVSDPIVVAKAALRAADVARWRSAFDASDRLVQRALDTLDDVARSPALVDVEVEAFEAFVSTARRRVDPAAIAAVTDRIETLAHRSGSEAARALVVFLRWGRVDEATDLDEILPTIREATEIAATTNDPYATVSSCFILAAWEWLKGNIDLARAHAARAIEASGTDRADDRPRHVPLAVLPQLAAYAAALGGDEKEAREHAYRRATAWMSQRNEVDPTGNLASVFYRALLEALLDEPNRVTEQLNQLQSASPNAFVALETASCRLLAAWADARSDVPGAHTRALTAIEDVEATGEHILRSCLRTFVADAQLSAGDSRAVDTLAQARGEAQSRKEFFWLAETMRLQAEADRRFGSGADAPGLLDQAEALAGKQGAGLLLARITDSRLRLTVATA